VRALDIAVAGEIEQIEPVMVLNRRKTVNATAAGSVVSRND
jgi:hypothetical protein